MANLAGSSLEDIKSSIGQPRTHKQRAEDLTGKLSSKRDWYDYLSITK